jgi:hypothetical protein
LSILKTSLGPVHSRDHPHVIFADNFANQKRVDVFTTPKQVRVSAAENCCTLGQGVRRFYQCTLSQGDAVLENSVMLQELILEGSHSIVDRNAIHIVMHK